MQINDRQILIRCVTPDEIDQVMALQALVHDAMEHKEHYVATTREDFLETMKDVGVLFGAYENGKLMAAASCIRNVESCHNLGQKCGQIPQDCYTFDAVFVHPDCRGLGLQRLFARLIRAQALKDGARSVWSTVSPGNLHSYNNLSAAGFRPYRKGVTMYGGHLRDILKLDLI